MSVGHIARQLEEAGIPTVIITAAPFQDRLEAMSPPRLVVTPYPMGRPLGLPHRADQQRAVLLSALNLLQDANGNGAVSTVSNLG